MGAGVLFLTLVDLGSLTSLSLLVRKQRDGSASLRDLLNLRQLETWLSATRNEFNVEGWKKTQRAQTPEVGRNHNELENRKGINERERS
ncbi:hypothetical protein AMTRI_Chr04g180620 [Amborella trichopoda]